MWIRSQDKTKLIKIDFVRVDGLDIEAMHGDTIWTKTGSYSSVKKAFKVLDMIQESIKGKRTTIYNYGQDGESIINNCFSNVENTIFQMPQEDEVD